MTSLNAIDSEGTSLTADSTYQDRAMKSQWQPINRHGDAAGLINTPKPEFKPGNVSLNLGQLVHDEVNAYLNAPPDQLDSKPSGHDSLTFFSQIWDTLYNWFGYVWSVPMFKWAIIIFVGIIIGLHVLEFILYWFNL